MLPRQADGGEFANVIVGSRMMTGPSFTANRKAPKRYFTRDNHNVNGRSEMKDCSLVPQTRNT